MTASAAERDSHGNMGALFTFFAPEFSDGFFPPPEDARIAPNSVVMKTMKAATVSGTCTLNSTCVKDCR